MNNTELTIPRRKRVLRACVWPLLRFCCWGFSPCPNCQSINGSISGHKGASGKTHGYPDYAPAAIQVRFCQHCGHEWEAPYKPQPDNWLYHKQLRIRGKLLPYRTYRKILAKVDYQTKEYKSCFR